MEKAIQKAEESRLQDRTVMDIMGMQRLSNPEPVTHRDVSQGNGTVDQWIKKGLEIEEKQ
jgi:hypothetical protein